MEQALARTLIACVFGLSTVAIAQQRGGYTISPKLTMKALPGEIPLYSGKAPGSEAWNWKEGRNNKNSMNVMTVYNVSQPALMVFQPESGKANSSAVIVCPGGGFHFIAVDHEGTNPAKELVENGFTVFLLKYRTVHIQGDNPFDDMINAPDPKAWDAEAVPVIPLAIADARKAIGFVRKHALSFGIKEDRIGIMGFSAGGLIAASTAFGYTPGDKPDFVIPVYADFPPERVTNVLQDAPPLYLLCTQDDEFGFATHAINLYNHWYAAKRPVELHLFTKGGHGFGTGIEGTTTHKWMKPLIGWLNNLHSPD